MEEKRINPMDQPPPQVKKKRGRPRKTPEQIAAYNSEQEAALEIVRQNHKPVPVPDDSQPGDNSNMVSKLMTLYSLPPVKTDADVQQRIYDYFDWCIETDSKPSVAALATALGIDRRTLWEWEVGKAYAGTKRASLIKHAKSIMNAMMEEMMQTGKINPVVGIFLMKNNMGYKDQSDVVITPNQPLGEVQDKAAIEAKYAELPNDD